MGSVATPWLVLGLATTTPVPAPPQAAVEPDCVSPMPQMIHKPAALYPKQMLRDGRPGAVRFHLTVHPDGSVTDFTVVDSTGREFESAARLAVLAWRAEPYPVGWCRTPVRMGSRMDFAVA